MTKEELFEIWAPKGSIWSDWAKPVLFAHMNLAPLSDSYAEVQLNVGWLAECNTQSAIVADLPGEMGVSLGLILAKHGIRPVPLYNAAPGPAGERQFETAGNGEKPVVVKEPLALVSVLPIIAALYHGAEALKNLSIPANAPPAFLLDSNRRTGSGIPRPGKFDNRSVSFPTDFPSAETLIRHGIARVILVQTGHSAPQPDLAHTLLRWQEASIPILGAALSDTALQPLTIQKPSRFRSMWYRFATALRLTPNPLGGFGGTIPESPKSSVG